MSPARWLLAALAALLLAGCATAPPVTPAPGWPSEAAARRAATMGDIRTWTIRGRLGVHTGREGFSAAIVWRQDGDRFDIRLFDQLGRQVAWLRGDGGQVSLTNHRGKTFRAQSAEQLMRAQLGWALPIRSLLYWVKGLPDPKLPAWREEYDDGGRLVRLEQGGWSVRIPRYLSPDERAFPALIKLRRKDFSAKLLIKHWE